ncbi:hypothetical protein [uncultured Albimonas sp.]|uniref:hypothetical protein n=1 Tax=uncultured Albimonas sp. TaxID=1331701 RepID=UPI0030EB8D42|tara:strand:- start:644 stop:817 length:174 start_codon:yes stop_codon:yes gene_type:complete
MPDQPVRDAARSRRTIQAQAPLTGIDDARAATPLGTLHARIRPGAAARPATLQDRTP